MPKRVGFSVTANLTRRLGLAITLFGLAVTGVEALPLNAAALHDPGVEPALVPVQHRPGYYKGREYRREMRRYRGDPGARYTLRNKRRVFCRRSPQYC